MEKTNLVQEFRTRVGEDNHEFISDQTFESMADVYLPRFADDTKITDDTWKEPIAALKNFAGQQKSSRMAFATKYEAEAKTKQQQLIDNAVAAAKVEWEKTNGKGGDGDGDGNKGGTGDGGGENNDVSKAVEKALKDYNVKLFGEDGKSGLIGGQLNTTAEFIKTQTHNQEQARLSEIGKQLKDFLTGEKATKEFAINLAVKNIVGGIKKVGEADVDALKLQVKKEYESVYKEAYGDGGKPFGGESAGGDGDGDGVDAEIKKYLDEKYEADKKRTEKQSKIKEGLK